MDKKLHSLMPVRAPRSPICSDRFNPSMLITAREARGMTQAQLAATMGVSQPLIVKWETDVSKPDDAQIALLAHALAVQADLFFVDRPRRLASMSDFYHRSLAKARRIDVKAIHARCNIVDLQIDRLLSISESEVDRIPDIDPHNHYGDVDHVAAMARVALNVEDGPVKNLVEVIERNGGIVIDRQMEVDDIDALCRWVPELPKLFFINGSRPADRIRFSLAHELGHTIMHFGRDYNLDEAEKQANAFASAFLMPAKDIRRDFTPDLGMPELAALKRKWRVSIQALIVRAFSLGAIDKRRYESLFVHLSRNGWRKTEPITVDGESPRVFNQLLQKAIEMGFTRSDLAKLLFVQEADIADMLTDASSPTWANDGVRMRLAR
jgi:Zn-dependent peptidase ImmA (M78 family)/DNA-binding XRE family transcriptional regulator